MRAILAVLALLLVASKAAAAVPQRIVSINLCADQYLLALANPAQILALSPYAANAATSAYAARAAGIARIADDAESLLRFAPGGALASVWSRPSTIALIRRRGMPLLVIGEPVTLAGIGAQIVAAAAFLGRPAAPALARLAFAMRRARGVLAGRRVLYLERGMYPARAGSLVAELLRHAGAVNAAPPGQGAISVEGVLAAAPDMLLTSAPRGGDLGVAALSHPVLVRAFPPAARGVLPGASIICAGPQVVAALSALAKLAGRRDGRLGVLPSRRCHGRRRWGSATAASQHPRGEPPGFCGTLAAKRDSAVTQARFSVDAP